MAGSAALLLTAFLTAGQLSCSEAAPQETTIDFDRQISKLCDPEQFRVYNSKTGAVDFKSSITKFTQILYLDILKKNESSNFVFSPLSIHSALSLLFLGSTDNSLTQRELLRALGNINNPCVLNLIYRDVIESYKNQDSFLYGNRIWLQEGLEIGKEYEEDVVENFNADIRSANFADPKARDVINNWVRDLTNGKLKELVESFSPDTKAFLANALYFKEKWKFPFTDKDALKRDLKRDFMIGRSKVKVPMMQLTSEEIIYGEITHNGAQAEVVSIPYQNEDFEMQIIVPKKNNHLEWMEQNLKLQEDKDLPSGEYFNIFSEAKDSTDLEIIDVRITMPPFQTESKFDASSVLETLGVERVFTERAELGRLSPNAANIALSRVLHRAAVEVTVNGTEGAAATGVELALFSADFGINKNVVVDRPFIFVIQDKVNDIPVLVGRVGDPTLSSDL